MTLMKGWCMSGHHKDCRGGTCPCCKRGHKPYEEVEDA